MGNSLDDCERKYEDEDKVEVCRMGRNLGEGMAEGVVEDVGYDHEPGSLKFDDELGMHFHQGMDAFTSTSEFANEVSPKIRSMAGKVDRGNGTYTKIPNSKDNVIVESRESDLFSTFREEAGSAFEETTERMLTGS